jgi:FKBP-type peptidyl-prolyl cis-trans isomerase FkpA
MARILFVFFIFFIVTSCTNRSEYPGFKKSRTGIHYKLIKIGEENRKAVPGDYITVHIQYFTFSDSLFFTGSRKICVSEPSYKGSIDECFTMLSEKENAVFVLSAGDFFEKTLHSSLPSFIKPGDMIKISVEMDEIQTEEEYTREKEAFLEWIEDFGEYEKVIMKQFIAQGKLNVIPNKNGIYELAINKGNGRKIETGDTITINFEGKFLDGKFFDSTKKRNQPFQLVYGTEWQVIKGLEDALALMEEGSKSVFIFPSELAFGQEGSSTGIIPPYTSVIYEVEVLEVKKGN